MGYAVERAYGGKRHTPCVFSLCLKTK